MTHTLIMVSGSLQQDSVEQLLTGWQTHDPFLDGSRIQHHGLKTYMHCSRWEASKTRELLKMKPKAISTDLLRSSGMGSNMLTG